MVGIKLGLAILSMFSAQLGDWVRRCHRQSELQCVLFAAVRQKEAVSLAVGLLGSRIAPDRFEFWRQIGRYLVKQCIYLKQLLRNFLTQQSVSSERNRY
jgi:hypothetical protein